MKLSKKGFKKIISTCKFDDAIATYTLNFSSPDKDYCFEVQGTSFKSNDFEDCVMLTVEEARAIKERLSDLMLVAGSDRYRKVVQRSLDAIISSLNQIEQEEGKL